MIIEKELLSRQVSEFKVSGITCMDCSAKFEKAVSQLPGIASANLNAMTGKLVVEGMADLESIRELGKEENYTIDPVQQPKAQLKNEFQVDGIT
ncbi:MAG: heavy-metal-associated domain-containing protein [Syntrophomonas sp.]|nr:heavy-metal-associated domain-containing protein [Syntrophomonas sp.]